VSETMRGRGICQELREEIYTLRADVERLTQERDELRDGINAALRQIQTPGSPPPLPLGATVAHYARLIRERAEAAERKLAGAAALLRECEVDIFQTARVNFCNLTGKDIALPEGGLVPSTVGRRIVHQSGVEDSLALRERVRVFLAALGEWKVEQPKVEQDYPGVEVPCSKFEPMEDWQKRVDFCWRCKSFGWSRTDGKMKCLLTARKLLGRR